MSICLRTVFQRVSAAFGVFNNSFLIVLILLKSPRSLGNYKWLMVYISAFEVLYSVLDGLLVPKMHSKGSAGLIITLVEDAWLPRGLLLASNVLYCTFFGMSMAVFAIHFIYRYLVVSGNWYLNTHDRRVTTFLLIFPVFFGVFWNVLSFFTFGPTAEADLFIERSYLSPNGLLLSDVSYVGLYFYPVDAQGIEHIGWGTIIGFSIQSVFIMSSFLLIFFFGYKCHCYTQSLSKVSSRSASYRSLQSQLFYALVLQTCIPVLLMHVPSTVSLAAAFLNISVETVSEVLSCTIALYPALDPLPSIFIIKNYRSAIIVSCRSLFRRATCRKPMTVQMVEGKVDIKMTHRSKFSAS